MRIANNIMAMNADRQLGVAGNKYSKSMEKLSSGQKINRAGDDAAGLAISEKMRGQIRGLDKASSNAQDGISLIQTAEGALNESHAVLQRMRELAVQASNDTNTDSDRGQIQNEISNLAKELDRIGNSTEFNTKKLLDGSAQGISERESGSIKANNNSSISLDSDELKALTDALKDGSNSSLQNGAYTIIRVSGEEGGTFDPADFKVIGPDGKESTDITVDDGKISVGGTVLGTAADLTADTNSMKTGESVTLVFGKTEEASSDIENSVMLQIGANSGQTTSVSMKDMRAEALGVDKLDFTSKFGAQNGIETVNNALEKVSSQRSTLGATQNRLEHTISNLDNAGENLQAAESRIRDTDMAKEMVKLTGSQILQQAAQSMLAQANQAPQGVLSLLG